MLGSQGEKCLPDHLDPLPAEKFFVVKGEKDARQIDSHLEDKERKKRKDDRGKGTTSGRKAKAAADAREIRELHPWNCRRLPGRSCERKHASASKIVEVVAGARARGPLLAIARNRANDEPRLLLPQRLGEAAHGELGRAILAAVGDPAMPQDRADVDDMAPPARPHPR